MNTHPRSIFHFMVLLALVMSFSGSTLLATPAHAFNLIDVDTTDGGFNPSDGHCSLAEAIYNANNDAATYSECAAGAGADNIVFDDALATATITLTADLPAIWDTTGDALTIEGGGDISVDGNNARQVFVVLSPATLKHLTVTGGRASSGGGAFAQSADLTVIGSTFVGNTAYYPDAYVSGGGAIYFSGPTLTVEASTFSGNTSAGQGGAIFNFAGTVNITNSTFASNSATAGNSGNTGGALFSYGMGAVPTPHVTINDSTFSNNAAGAGSGADLEIYYGTLDLYNSILANSTSGEDCHAGGGTTIAGASNLIEDSTTACGFTNGTDGNIVGSDPALGAIIGSPAYFPLRQSSPAIDAGDNSHVPGAVTTDEVGHSRFLDVPMVIDTGAGTPPIVDMGAVEMGVVAISGNSGIPGATLSFSGDSAGSTIADGSANYSFSTVSYWNGTVTPSKTGCTFSPVNRLYANVTTNQTSQDYTATCSVGFVSQAGNDGWVLESGEKTNAGGSLNSKLGTIYLGDDAANKQYRDFLSFNASTLPDSAVITGATLKLRKQAIVGGGNPITTFQGIYVDLRKGFFSTAAKLESADFKAAANKSGLGPFKPAPSGTLYTITLPSKAFPYINKLSTGGGLTQLRLRFKLDDNNNALANYIAFYSGNAASAKRPVLTITFHVP